MKDEPEVEALLAATAPKNKTACPDCGGTGRVVHRTGYLKSVTGRPYRGRAVSDPCWTCNLTGVVDVNAE